jgi:preprotein translocase subunit Sss1
MENEFAQTAIEGPKQFIKDGVAFINRCAKPDRKGTKLLYSRSLIVSSVGTARKQ